MMGEFVVQKRDYKGVFLLEYPAEVVERGSTWLCVRAVFAYEKADLGFTTFLRGDLFTEWFYSDRWYNVFQVNSGTEGALRGWYCNITRPALITADSVSADDLALDVFVMPDGTVHILDEDEFASLNLSAVEQAHAQQAVAAIRQAVIERRPPFDII